MKIKLNGRKVTDFFLKEKQSFMKTLEDTEVASSVSLNQPLIVPFEKISEKLSSELSRGGYLGIKSEPELRTKPKEELIQQYKDALAKQSVMDKDTQDLCLHLIAQNHGDFPWLLIHLFNFLNPEFDEKTPSIQPKLCSDVGVKDGKIQLTAPLFFYSPIEGSIVERDVTKLKQYYLGNVVFSVTHLKDEARNVWHFELDEIEFDFSLTAENCEKLFIFMSMFGEKIKGLQSEDDVITEKKDIEKNFLDLNSTIDQCFPKLDESNEKKKIKDNIQKYKLNLLSAAIKVTQPYITEEKVVTQLMMLEKIDSAVDKKLAAEYPSSDESDESPKEAYKRNLRQIACDIFQSSERDPEIIKKKTKKEIHQADRAFCRAVFKDKRLTEGQRKALNIIGTVVLSIIVIGLVGIAINYITTGRVGLFGHTNSRHRHEKRKGVGEELTEEVAQNIVEMVMPA